MEIRAFAVVKAGLATATEVMAMEFGAFERLERFSILTSDIERHYSKKGSSLEGQQRPSEGKTITLKRDGTMTRG